MHVEIQWEYSQPDNYQALTDEPLAIHKRSRDAQNETLLIFVHGLGGHRYGPKSSWGRFPHLIFENFPVVDVGLYTYRTRFGRWKFWESIPVETEANIFAHILRDLQGYKNYILVAHSMGGLVCLSAISYLVETQTPRIHRDTLSRFKGLFLMATPQLGSDVVPEGLDAFNLDARALRTNSTLVAHIDRVITTSVDLSGSAHPGDKISIPTWAVRGASDRLVSRLSSSVHLGEDRIKVVHGSHGAVVKPLTEQDDGYIFVAANVRDCLSKTERHEDTSIGSVITTKEELLQQALNAQQFFNAQIAQFVQENGITATIQTGTSTQDISRPPFVRPLADRGVVIKGLLDTLSKVTWLALYGTAGTGKTQLANLLAERLGSCKAWIRLRDLSAEQAEAHLEAALTNLTGKPKSTSNRGEWLDKVCQRLGRDALIVMEDLPRFSGNEQFLEMLVALANTCERRGVRIVSTGTDVLPHSVGAILGANTHTVVPIPLFNETEIRALLEEYGAPTTLLTPGFISFINHRAHQHPILISAAAKYLSQRNWVFTDEELSALLRSEHAAHIQIETIRQVIENIESVDSRMLLYRLGLSSGPLSADDVVAIAGVEVGIERPLERLTELSGLWVQADADARFIVSPLIRELGGADLSPDTQIKCHRVYAERIVSRESITVQETIDALDHFDSAGAFNHAGALLVTALYEAEELSSPDIVRPLLNYWASRPLPEYMNQGVKIYLRVRQIVVRHKHGLPTAYLVTDLDRLFNDAAAAEGWAVLGAVVASPLGPDSPIDPATANRHLLKALGLLPDALLPNGEPYKPPVGIVYESIIWWHTLNISTGPDLLNWIETLEQMDTQQRHRAFQDGEYDVIATLAFDRVWLHESHKPENERDWQSNLAMFAEVGERARNNSMELLWACAIRSQLVILAEYMQDTTTAVALAETSLAQASGDPRVQFLIRECIGRQSALPLEDARQWLEETLKQNTASFAHLRLLVLISASRTVGLMGNSSLAVEYAQHAVELATSSTELQEYEDTHKYGVLHACAELAVAHWLDGNIVEAINTWDAAAEQLFSLKDDSDYWKGHAMLFETITRNMVKYFPQTPPDIDGRSYGYTMRGMFIHDLRSTAVEYNDGRECILLSGLMDLSALVGNAERGLVWASRGHLLAKGMTKNAYAALFANDLLSYLLNADRYTEALEIALNMGAFLVAGQLQTSKADMALSVSKLDLDVTDLLGPATSQLWQRAEQEAVMLGLMPAILRLSMVALADIERSQLYAREVVAFCRERSTRSSDSQLWETAANLIEGIFVEMKLDDEITRTVEALNDVHSTIPRIIVGLGLGFRLSTTPVEAIRHQVGVLQVIETQLKPFATTYRLIVVPCVEEYWRVSFVKQRVQFSAPSLVEKLLARTHDMLLAERVQRILDVIAGALNVRLPD
jgi:pimeloyl-ACP methyl ester carboxylesterase